MYYHIVVSTVFTHVHFTMYMLLYTYICILLARPASSVQVNQENAQVNQENAVYRPHASINPQKPTCTSSARYSMYRPRYVFFCMYSVLHVGAESEGTALGVPWGI